MCASLGLHEKIEKQPPEMFYKKCVLIKISQNSHESTCSGVTFLIMLQAFVTLCKMTLRCFFSECCKITPLLRRTSNYCS